MKIIDAHLHFCPNYGHFDELAVCAEHENTAEHLKNTYRELGIVGGVVMGNRGMEPEKHNYPEYLRYCIGIDRSYMAEHKLSDAYDLVEVNLKREECVGIKLYPGYNKLYITDEIPGSSDGNESACNARDLGWIPESGRSPGEGNGYPLQYSCLKSPWTEEPVGYSPWCLRFRYD